ncbi:protein regulator of cytokinesis 1 isoform X2 [Phyllobates terribilis]|uniref:protein regulator of cytokinesis 1 isoform X2 n=1 Tax=Phyllobates terribilis TaxID=111132 RepID=UPI003CCB0162
MSSLSTNHNAESCVLEANLKSYCECDRGLETVVSEAAEPRIQRSAGAEPVQERSAAMRRSEAIAAESVACLNSALARLRDIWEEIGIPEDQRLQRTDAVKRHVNILLTRMIEEEESLKNRLQKSIDICRKELNDLCEELHLPPFEEDEESTILQVEKDLRTRVDVMLKQKKERMQELKQLKQRDQSLCDILCTPPYYIEGHPVPSLDELDQFRRHLAALSAEKDLREAEFVKTKKHIILCMEELDHLPDTSFERDVVCEEEEAFCLSKENLAALHQLLFQLEEQIQQNNSLCEELRAKIVELWERLQIPEGEREAFSVHMTGSKGKTIKALQDEVDRLQELKLQNIKNVIQVIRTELSSYWDKCFYSNEQRQAFAPFYDDYSEELLCLHDAEIEHLKQYYETHKEMFEGVQKWEENWRLFLEFDKKATDPNRFTNRGGNLLKEEKQRAKLQKMLPKLEEELKVRIAAWEEEQGREFFMNGKKFMDYVTEQWNRLHLEKEKEKQERLVKKSRQLEEEMYYGSAPRTPNKRRVLGTTTPSKVRKLNGTCVTNSTNTTLRSAFGGTMCHSPVSRPPPSGGKPGLPIRTPTRIFKTPQARRLEKNKENMSQLNGTAMSGGCQLTIPAQRNLSVNSVASTYSEFARDSTHIDSTSIISSENFQKLQDLTPTPEF